MLRVLGFSVLLLNSVVTAEIIDLATCIQNKDLDSCHVEFAQKIKPIVKSGDASNGIESADPLLIDSMDVEFKDLKIKTTFTDNEIEGLSNYIVESFKTNKGRKLLKLEMTNSAVASKGKYKFDGSKSFVQSISDGDYDFSLNNTGLVLVIKLELENGRVVIKQDPLLSIKPGQQKVELHNLFDGKADNFAKIVHKFIHDNPQVYLDQLKGPLIAEVGKTYRKAFNIAAKNVKPEVYGF